MYHTTPLNPRYLYPNKIKMYQQFTLLVISNASSLPANSKFCSANIHDFRLLTAEENRGTTSARDSQKTQSSNRAFYNTQISIGLNRAQNSNFHEQENSVMILW